MPWLVADLALTLLGWPRWLFAAALMVALLGWVTYHPVLDRVSVGLCLALATLVIALAALEVAFRTAGFDFNRTEARLKRLPPFFRKPLIPTGTVFHRRAGPERWTGQVLRTGLREAGIWPNSYTHEPVITVNHDAQGFRNERGWDDWEIAVAGDSFTELGHLPYDGLFTTELAGALGWRVRNLGVSHTGPLTQLHYLEAYGLAASTREVLVVFFGGNDVADLLRESEAVTRFRESGTRPSRGRRPQTSMLRAVREALVRGREPRQFASEPNAWFRGDQGLEPVTIDPGASGRDLVSEPTRAALDAFLTAYAEFGRLHGVRARLAYLPSKEAVWRAHLTFVGEAPAGWSGDFGDGLAAYLASRCGATGIRFLDLTPTLIAETERMRRRLFNGMHDTHLNALGSEVVARALAAWWREGDVEPKPEPAGVGETDALQTLRED